MSGADFRTKVSLTLLSVLIAVALTYASIALPGLVNSILFDTFDFPSYDAQHPINLEEAETFFQENYIRWIGYGSLAVVLILVILGLVIENEMFQRKLDFLGF